MIPISILMPIYKKNQSECICHAAGFAPAHRSGGPHHQTGVYNFDNMGETLVMFTEAWTVAANPFLCGVKGNTVQGDPRQRADKS